jgi:hypothetical protein
MTNKLPGVGTNGEIFGWDKWNAHVLEVLELKGLDATGSLKRHHCSRFP